MSEDVWGPKNHRAGQADAGAPDGEPAGQEKEADRAEVDETEAEEYRTAEQEVAGELEAMANSLVDSAFTLALEAGASRWFNLLPRNGRGAIQLDEDTFENCSVENATKVFRLSILLRNFAGQLEEDGPASADRATDGAGAN